MPLVFVLLVLSFLRSIFVDPGTVENTVTSESTFVDTSSASFCTLCQEVKPPRAHHCSSSSLPDQRPDSRLGSKCKRCVTKMDHHCPWINNCVGWGNYKLFLLACTYCSLLGLVCFIFCLLRYIWIGISVVLLSRQLMCQIYSSVPLFSFVGFVSQFASNFLCCVNLLSTAHSHKACQCHRGSSGNYDWWNLFWGIFLFCSIGTLCCKSLLLSLQEFFLHRGTSVFITKLFPS